MSIHENKTVVRRLVEGAQVGRDLALVDQLLSPDFVDHSPMGGLPPTREGVKILFAGLHNAFPDLSVIIREQIAEDENVVTRKTFIGTHAGEFLGVPGSNRKIEFDVIDILRVVDGQITEHRHIVDQLGLLQQLGAIAN